MEYACRWVAAHGDPAENKERVEVFIDEMQEIVAKKMWRRWSVNTFARYDHSRAGDMDMFVTWAIWLETQLQQHVPARVVSFTCLSLSYIF